MKKKLLSVTTLLFGVVTTTAFFYYNLPEVGILLATITLVSFLDLFFD